MKLKERLLECKVKKGIKSDYELAELIGINRARIHEYMQDKGKPNAYLAVRIGEVLGIHPLILIAEFEAESAKDQDRKGFWLNFGRRIKSGAVKMLALIFISSWLHVGETEAVGLDTHNVYYVKRDTQNGAQNGKGF